MKAVVTRRAQGWKVETTDPPILAREEWLVANGLGVLFIVMAVLQLISFDSFKNILDSLGVSGPRAWAFGIILAELFAAVGFFRLRLSYLARVVSAGLAILVSGFWFILNLQAITGVGSQAASSGLFGKYLNQTPGWWTVLEVTVLLFWTMYAVALTRYSVLLPKRKV